MAFNVPKHTPKRTAYQIDTKEKPTPIPKSPQYLIQGYKWFDGTYGNTYHTVTITDLKTGRVIHRDTTMRYGYGDQWKQSAYDELKKSGLVKEHDRFNHELNGKRFIYSETEVQRKKDLF
jgi:hypothetical protein